MDEIQKSIVDAIKIQVNEKIKNLQFDKTCYGKVVAIRDDVCDVEINGKMTQCKIRNGLQISVNDIVLVRLINNDFSNKFVDAKLGTVGDGVGVELIGSLSSLLTTVKTNIVAAINEVFNKAEDVEDNLAMHKAEIATSTQLGHVKVGQNLAIDSDGTLHAQASGGKKVVRFVIGTIDAGWTAKDCDYLCDGTNDQVEIQQALNALPATGGEVVILDGTYNITASIHIPKNNVSLRGNGNATILKRMYNSTSTDIGKGLITLKGKKDCKIQGLQIDGNKATYTSSYNYGIYLDSSSKNNTVTGNTCNDNACGIRLYSSSNNTVTGNTCNNNSIGIYLYLSSDNTVTGNTCNNNNIDGIYLDLSSDNTVTCNTCNNNNFDGISLSSSSNNTITGNTCNNGSYGIYLYSSSDNNTVTCNTCNNNNIDGISLSSSSNNTITGNTCNNNSIGIYLYSSSDNNTITGNTCNNNNIDGISLDLSSDNTVTCNTCNNNDHGIYLYSSSNNNTVTGNTCNNNRYDGISLSSSSDNNTITGNTCNNNNIDGISLSSSSNNTITGNTCNNGSYGIYLYSSSNNTITGNTCNNNNYNGIDLYSSSNNTITDNTCICGTGQTSDYDLDQYTIRLSGSSNNYNLISSNNCMGKAVVIDGGIGNSAWGNKFDNTDNLPYDQTEND